MPALIPIAAPLRWIQGELRFSVMDMAMRDEQLQKLLQAAEPEVDRAAFVPAEMATRVRALHQRRRRNRRIIAVVAPLALAIIAVASWRISRIDHGRLEVGTHAKSGRPDSLATGPAPPAIAADDVSRLSAEADFHLRVARRIVAMRQHDRAIERARGALAAQEPDGSVREQLDTVAYRMILRADALRVAMRPVEEVVVIYQDVVRLFPNTSSAELARQRLTDLGAFKGDT